MASRLLHSARSAVRASGSRFAYTSRSSSSSKTIRAARRGMASGAHAHETKPDTPWIIGSALLFGPALIYLLGPARKVTGHSDPHADPHPSKHGAAPAPVMQKVNQADQTKGKEEEDSPGEQDTDANEDSARGEPAADKSSGGSNDSDASEDGNPSSEGDNSSQEPSADDVSESVKQSVKSDAPKSAKSEEEKQRK